MTSGLRVRKPVDADLPLIKKLADDHRRELGFVRTDALRNSLRRGWLLVAEAEGGISGFVHWWARRDGTIVVYNIVVDTPVRRLGLGSRLLRAVVDWAEGHDSLAVQLKCPVDLPANEFYAQTGFRLYSQDAGKRRALNCWRMDLVTAGTSR